MHVYVYIMYKINENFDRKQLRLDGSVYRKLLKKVTCDRIKWSQGCEKGFLHCQFQFENVMEKKKKKEKKTGNDRDPLLTYKVIF